MNTTTVTTTKSTKSVSIVYWRPTGRLATLDLGAESVRCSSNADDRDTVSVFARRIERLSRLAHLGTSTSGAGEYELTFGRADGAVLGTVRVRVAR